SSPPALPTRPRFHLFPLRLPATLPFPDAGKCFPIRPPSCRSNGRTPAPAHPAPSCSPCRPLRQSPETLPARKVESKETPPPSPEYFPERAKSSVRSAPGQSRLRVSGCRLPFARKSTGQIPHAFLIV